MESNFAFLAESWPLPATIGEFAEKNLYDDPNTTLSKLRLFGEKIAACMLQEEEIPEADQTTQSQRLQMLKDHGILPYNIKEIFYQLKKYGNKAVHAGYDSQEDAQNCLSFAYKLATWFVALYSDDFEAAKRPFVMPEKRDLTAELSALRTKHEQALQELEVLKRRPSASSSREERKIISFQQAEKIKFDERQTRQIIDSKLRDAGWEVDTENLKWPDALPEKGKNLAIAEWPCGKRRADYALFLGKRFVGVVEAKHKKKDVVSDLGQAQDYAKLATQRGKAEFAGGPWGEYKVPFMFASNGREYFEQLKTKSGIWFLDGRKQTNHPKALRNWFSPQDLEQVLSRDIDSANSDLRQEPFDYLRDTQGLALRDYQIEAIQAVEKGILAGRETLLLAMATGTGKTRTAIGLMYRLIKSKRFRRILFLVDRRSLGIQAADAFKDAKIEELQSFYNIFQIKELGDKHPDEFTKVHVATVQGLVRRLFYADDEKPEALPSPGQYDCIVVDEAHRGYLLDREIAEEELHFKNQQDYISKYRSAIEYFDAVRIALTATPALHTSQIFGPPIYSYGYRQAVIDGYLIDHEPPCLIETELKQQGIHFAKSSRVQVYNRKSASIEEIARLEDEVDIEIEGFNTRVITESFNRVVAGALAREIDPLDEGKTLIFAAGDEHADLLVELLVEAYEAEGFQIHTDAIKKITGSIDSQDEWIKRFKNEKYPNIAVTVDLLTTGIDVPQITNLVFLRRVKSRILYDQMIGRATRLCPDIAKECFFIYDAVGLYDALEPYNTMRPVAADPKATFVKLVQELPQIDTPELKQQQIDMILAKLQRKRRQIENADARAKELFALKSGDKTIEAYIAELQSCDLASAEGKLLKDLELFDFLDTHRFGPNFQYISQHDDRLLEVKQGYGNNYSSKPGDYLEEFKRFLDEQQDKISALSILCRRPSRLSRKELKQLRLQLDEQGFSEQALNKAWNAVTQDDILADIIGFVRHLAIGAPLVSHEERIKQAMKQVRQMQDWTRKQKQWLDRIEKQLLRENILKPDDFELDPFKDHGGFKRIDKIFDGHLADILDQLNQHLYEEA